ncbi:MAG: GntR family transcriptional regulator [Herbinix sp.]|nr:GntR family transcriptional regulator [Herbinix sp.]
MGSKSLYIQLWEHYRNQILTGTYKYGEIFPTERELEKVHNCNRKTIRKALNMLVEEKLLVRLIGKGTFVNRPDLTLPLETIRGFSSLIKQEGMEVINKVLFFQKVEAGYRVSKVFGISKEDRVYKCVRVRYVNENPIALDITYIRDVFPELLKFDFNVYSLYEVMESYGQIPCNVNEEVSAIELQEMEAQYLNKKSGDFAYLITDITKNQDGIIIEYNKSYTVSDRFALSTDLI